MKKNKAVTPLLKEKKIGSGSNPCAYFKLAYEGKLITMQSENPSLASMEYRQ